MSRTYDPLAVEAKWQKRWEDAKAYETDLSDTKEKYYTHVMFPYPSGDKLHVGHWYNYGPADSFARFMRMQGKHVFSPMGFDAFGLPAENYAIKTGVHPDASTRKNVETMITQLKRIGCMYDWSKMVNTSTPEYYRWTQWLFLQMYKNKLAFRKKGLVNFCPKCQTVLANEQVWDGACERCDTPIDLITMTQWYWKTTQYAQQLLDGIDGLDWPEKTKLMQRNWIGRSEGCDVAWNVDASKIVLETFTTTVDTIYGVTFVAIAPDHPELPSLITKDQKSAVEKYMKDSSKKSEFDRQFGDKEKTGVFTGTYVLHPFTGKKIPLWVADYVLMTYGTGVVMGVPAHDQRDMDFAKKYTLEIIQSIQSSAGESIVYDNIDKYSVQGSIIDSGDFTGLSILDGRKIIIETLEKGKIGKRKIQFRLRDWCVSRQRYWGAPIPIVYDPEGKPHPVPEEHLPWVLPTDIEFKPTGESPLKYSHEFKERTEKIFGKGWTPEYDTMDTFVCSSFYYLMYLQAEGYGMKEQRANSKEQRLIDPKVEQQWMPVDMYIGGAEHACMHLIYARFVMMALKDWGYVSHSEPFKRLIHQGVITNKGVKMSKSKGNVVSPDAFVDKHGSDVFRMYLMFMGPFTEGGDWNDTGIKGIDRFALRLYKLIEKNSIEPYAEDKSMNKKVVQEDADSTAALHRAIKKVGEDIAGFRFNTAISALMELLNVLEEKESIAIETMQTLTKLLAPLAPHLAEELWEITGGKGLVIDQRWPEYDAKLLVSSTMTIAIQVNGKLRGSIEVAASATKEEIIETSKKQENVAKFIASGIKKEIYVPHKLVSFVVS
jgi:leucyl-tRNA synthetase